MLFTQNLIAQSKPTISYDSLTYLIREAANNPKRILKISDSLRLIAKEKKDAYKFAAMLLVNGVANVQLGNQTEALSNQMKAFDIFDSFHDKDGKAISLLCLAFTHMEVKNYKKAYEYLLQSQRIAGKSNYKLNNSIDANLGIVYYHFKEYEKAIASYKKSIFYYESNNNFYGSSMIYHSLACSYQKLHNIDKAIEYELKALKHQEKSESVYVLAIIANKLGDLYFLKGEMDLSKKYFEIGGKEAYKLNSPNFTLDYLEGMLNWNKANLKFDKALQFSEKHTRLKDSLYSIDSTKTAFEMEERFQNKLKNKEIELLKTQKSLDDVKANETKNWAVVFVIIAGLFLIIIVVLYRNYQLNKKTSVLLEVERKLLEEQNQQLVNENIFAQFETLKNQISPHFLFNSLNALTSLIKTDKEKALQFAREFSKIFRNTLEIKERNLITLKEELEHVNSYLFLQKMRFESNLIINFTIESQYLNDYLLPFALQMVIENAVKHNEISIEKPLTISIETKVGFLWIANNLQGRQNIEESTKTGVSNIKSRYKYITEIEPTFEIINGYFCVKLPLLKE